MLREWSEHYQTYQVTDEASGIRMSSSPVGVSVASHKGGLILPHDFFLELVRSILEHGTEKGFYENFTECTR